MPLSRVPFFDSSLPAFKRGHRCYIYLSPITEQTLPWSAAVILAVSTFSGSLVAGKKAGNRGLYHGLLIGALFFLAVWLTSGLFMPGQAVLGVFPKLVVSLSAGAAGGVLGVGFS